MYGYAEMWGNVLIYKDMWGIGIHGNETTTEGVGSLSTFIYLILHCYILSYICIPLLTLSESLCFIYVLYCISLNIKGLEWLR